MRIVETIATRTTGVRRSERRQGVGNSFGGLLETDEATAPSAAGGLGSLVSASALWALQGVPDATDGRSKGLDRGEDLLGDLETLQRDLALGMASVAKLQQIATKVRNRPDLATLDAKLAMILDEIELRVAVELAKRDCFV
jgi:Class II flagellar assembly regulator